MLRKIVILGPESTGKSTLSKQLAAHYNTLWCPEYARGHLLEHGTNYRFDDLLTIAQGQLALEEKYVQAVETGMRPEPQDQNMHGKGNELPLQPLLFIDTDMYVMKVWCEYVFGKCHQFILNSIVERQYDLYMLCNIDLPWVADELREYPDEQPRIELYHIYKDIMTNQQKPWVDINGSYEKRLEKAIAAVDLLLKA